MISWFEKHNKLSWIITILIAIIIFYISSLTFETTPFKDFLGIEAIAYHFYSFLFLSVFLLISLVQGKNKKLILLAILLCVFYAITDEIHQLFVPGRTSTFSDVIIDFAGILFAGLIYSLHLKFNQK